MRLPASSSTPRVYTINLALPPSERYKEMVDDFKPLVGELKLAFNEVLTAIKPRFAPLWFCHLLAWLCLRGLHSKEQTFELYGLSTGLGLPIYLLVAYNVLLDLLMGCTSGGVLIQDQGSAGPHMQHFRTLDWGMPALRKAIVQYNFVKDKDGEVLATTIGYAGFVGVLTGVKRDLSVSLNFRPYHNAHGWTWANFQYYHHLLMVLLGYRPSVSAHLRDLLLPRKVAINHQRSCGFESQKFQEKTSFKTWDFEAALRDNHTTAAYIILCDGRNTVVLEKDLQSSRITRSSAFITVTNHDISLEARNKSRLKAKQPFLGIGMEELISESVERRMCLTRKWEAHVQRRKRKNVQTIVNMDVNNAEENAVLALRMQDLKRWIQDYPICNEETHFVCIMDPKEGIIKWVRCFEEGEIIGGH